MKGERKPKDLTQDELRWILEITRRLAAPLDLDSMLREVVDVARGVLDADVGVVWLYDHERGELALPRAGRDDTIRITTEQGIAGECLRRRAVINVPDCYADPRFDREVDRQAGYHSRCMLALPLVGADESAVGVLQIVNRREGVFNASDETVALLLADQCAVALQRVRMTEQLVSAGKLRREIAVARDIQMATLPKAPPPVPGYDVAGFFMPADETGGDTYDFIPLGGGRYAILMGDATGHGIGPALMATHVRAMLRVAMRLGADIDDAFRHMNEQLADDLPPDRYVTVFLGLLDANTHSVRYHSGGQGPLLHYRAALGICELHPPTTCPLGAVRQPVAQPASVFELAPGDILALASDGVYEYQDRANREFGADAVAALIRAHHDGPMSELIGLLLNALSEFGGGAEQADDLSVALIRRLPGTVASAAVRRQRGGAEVERRFPRTLDALAGVFEFIAQFFAAEGLDSGVRLAVELTVEELFANMVKHNAAGASDIRIALRREDGALVGTVEDFDSPRFDVAEARPVNISTPLAERRPGGLGLHLIRRMVDSIEYAHAGRTSTITFRKRTGAP